MPSLGIHLYQEKCRNISEETPWKCSRREEHLCTLQDEKFRQSLCNMLCGIQRNTVTNGGGGGGRGNTRNGMAVSERRKSRYITQQLALLKGERFEIGIYFFSTVPTESTKMAATKVWAAGVLSAVQDWVCFSILICQVSVRVLVLHWAESVCRSKNRTVRQIGRGGERMSCRVVFHVLDHDEASMIERGKCHLWKIFVSVYNLYVWLTQYKVSRCDQSCRSYILQKFQWSSCFTCHRHFFYFPSFQSVFLKYLDRCT